MLYVLRHKGSRGHPSMTFERSSGHLQQWRWFLKQENVIKMNKTIKTAALCAVVSMTAANADVYQGSSEYSYETPRDPIVTASIGGVSIIILP